MPEYSFSCSKKTCKHKFDEFCSFSDFNNNFKDVKCPQCGKSKPKMLFCPRAHFPNSTDKMNNFEYAAEKNMEKAQIESSTARELAKKKGLDSPYNDVPDFTENGKRMNFID